MTSRQQLSSETLGTTNASNLLMLSDALLHTRALAAAPSLHASSKLPQQRDGITAAQLALDTAHQSTFTAAMVQASNGGTRITPTIGTDGPIRKACHWHVWATQKDTDFQPQLLSAALE